MTEPLETIRDLVDRYDRLDVARRMDAGGQAMLEEVRTRSLVSIAESLDVIARNSYRPNG